MTRPEVKSGVTGATDGKEYPITGPPNNVAKVSAKRINDTTTESVGKPSDGKVIENVTVTVSQTARLLPESPRSRPDGEFTMKDVYEKQAGDSVGAPKKLTVGVQWFVSSEWLRWCPSRELGGELAGRVSGASFGEPSVQQEPDPDTMTACPRRSRRSVICSPSSPFDYIRSILPFVLEKPLFEKDWNHLVSWHVVQPGELIYGLLKVAEQVADTSPRLALGIKRVKVVRQDKCFASTLEWVVHIEGNKSTNPGILD
jgi:hypothetical protein